jgi:hypothetical protein
MELKVGKLAKLARRVSVRWLATLRKIPLVNANKVRDARRQLSGPDKDMATRDLLRSLEVEPLVAAGDWWNCRNQN